jgi:hypothetical protein
MEMKKVLVAFYFIITLTANFAQTDTSNTLGSFQIRFGWQSFINFDDVNSSLRAGKIGELKNNSFLCGVSYQFYLANRLMIGFSFNWNSAVSIENYGDTAVTKHTFRYLTVNLGYSVVRQNSFIITPCLGFGVNFDYINMKRSNMKPVSWDNVLTNSIPADEVKTTRFVLYAGLKTDYLLTINNRKFPLTIEMGYSLYPLKIIGDETESATFSGLNIRGMPDLYKSSFTLSVSFGRIF